MSWQERFAVKWFIGIFGLLGLYMTLLYSSVAQAQTRPNPPACEVVRCGSGTCIETPSGSVCQPTLTCANVLCQKGQVCEETANGPTCQPAKWAPIDPPEYSGDQCRLMKRYYHGQMVYRRVCPSKPIYKPRKHYRRSYYPRRWRYERPLRRYVHTRFCPPGHHSHDTDPAPDPDRVCTKIYAPVCAQKRVQCVKTPCPPVRQSFGNRCEAENAGYSVIRNGRCDSWRWPE